MGCIQIIFLYVFFFKLSQGGSLQKPKQGASNKTENILSANNGLYFLPVEEIFIIHSLYCCYLVRNLSHVKESRLTLFIS